MNFDITGQKAYVKDGPYRNQIGVVKRKGTQEEPNFIIVIDGQNIDVELKDIVLVGVDVRKFHEWCDQNGYL
ncbi:DUF3912 family protein [Bacillus sp. DX1.1]|uniref:DUF3912 family protein n=1 Tax=unclassified Bacillus (in: firmicutes) TaxID=185979 RepID=UPI0025705B37|nr:MULTISPECIES: DUF3912 family protein [unclassified Bacillus (in: firmicutes)]MDM5156447.1 DUF3912 family protein [Bacillus sp. DX1.1]WJE80715.1 DUF3912 family protein [Bacillus sp. DX3.1]